MTTGKEEIKPKCIAVAGKSAAASTEMA
jgi:hypothetical protein